MPNYRRNRLEGGTFFFTLALADRHADLLVREIAALRLSVSRARALYPFIIDAWVVLPDHLHAVWTLPQGDADFSTRWTLIKRGFSARLCADESRSASRIAKGERGIWQRRFWEHTIRDEADFQRHVDYVHFNPVKHCLVSHAKDWPFSSFRRAVAAGDYPADWGGADEKAGEFGERPEGRIRGKVVGCEEHPTLRLLHLSPKAGASVVRRLSTSSHRSVPPSNHCRPFRFEHIIH